MAEKANTNDKRCGLSPPTHTPTSINNIHNIHVGGEHTQHFTSLSTSVDVDEEKLRDILFEQVQKGHKYSLDDLYKAFNVFYYLPDREYFDVVLAVCLDRRVESQLPVWLYVIADSGNFKSEFYRAISKWEDIYSLSKITPNTLVSGKTVKENGVNVPVMGLLKQMDKKIMCIKDFSSVLTMDSEKRKEIFGQLRDVYDGSVSYGYGNFKNRIMIEAIIGAIIFTTPIIDKHTVLEAELGSRFLRIRHYPFSEEDARIRREYMKKQNGLLEHIRKRIGWLTRHFITNVETDKKIIMSNKWQDRIYDLVRYVAFMRGQVQMSWVHGHPRDPISEVRREQPTRIYQQLLKLGKMLCIIRGKKEFTEVEWNTLVRVAEDTIAPNIRNRVLKQYLKDNLQYKEGRAKELNVSRSFLSDTLRIMVGCQILDEDYELTDIAKKLMVGVYGVTVIPSKPQLTAQTGLENLRPRNKLKVVAQ